MRFFSFATSVAGTEYSARLPAWYRESDEDGLRWEVVRSHEDGHYSANVWSQDYSVLGNGSGDSIEQALLVACKSVQNELTRQRGRDWQACRSPC
jgi:hypothetical protein